MRIPTSVSHADAVFFAPVTRGARWYAVLATPRVIAQAQGNWKTPAVATGVYDGFEEQELLREVALAAARGQDAISLRESPQEITSDIFSKDAILASGGQLDLREIILEVRGLRRLISKDVGSRRLTSQRGFALPET